MGGSRVIVLAAKFKVKGKDEIFCKIIAYFEPVAYDALRIR